MLFGTIFEVTLNNLNIVESTRKPYVANYNRHIKPYLGATSVYNIKYKDVEAIFNRMDNEDENGTGTPTLHQKSGKVIMQNPKKSLSLQTKKNVLTIFRNVFRYLNEDEDEFKDFNFDPSKKILKKLNDTNEVRYASLDYRLKLSNSNEMLNIVRKIYQEITKLATPTLKTNGTPKILQDNVWNVPYLRDTYLVS
ncbi:MAG: hypothetical protein L3I99_08465 [Sulfurimonas sp.]|nr:hypothetical protein [Sulfurimonas sp.]